MSIIQLLSYDSFLIINKPLLKYLGGDAYQAIMLSELVTLSNAFKNTNQMKNHDSWFFRSVDDVERDTCLNDYHQRAAINGLVALNLVEVKRAGRPAQRYFKINEKKLASIIQEDFLREEDTQPVADDKKEKQAQFYEKMNTAIEKGFDAFKGEMDNIRKPFGAFMFTWSRLFKKMIGRNWDWTPERFGKLNQWFKNNESHFDYSILGDFFTKELSPLDLSDDSHAIFKWIDYFRSTPEKPSDLKVLDPSRYW